MKKIVLDFLRRGLVACGFGPLVLAAVYEALQRCGIVQTVAIEEVCLGIVSLFVLAFIAGGMNVLYQIERLPLAVAILIHGAALYVGYLATYLLNGWLEWGAMPVVVFSGIFVFGYAVIWGIIYSVIKKRTARLNAILEKKQQTQATE